MFFRINNINRANALTFTDHVDLAGHLPSLHITGLPAKFHPLHSVDKGLSFKDSGKSTSFQDINNFASELASYLQKN